MQYVKPPFVLYLEVVYLMLAINILYCFLTLKISPSSLIKDIWKLSYLKKQTKTNLVKSKQLKAMTLEEQIHASGVNTHGPFTLLLEN